MTKKSTLSPPETFPPYKFDAGTLAASWLAVALASGKDEDRPSLHRTVLVECFRYGVRLVATDGIVLLTAWVPAAAFTSPPEPAVDEAPTEVVIAIDAHGRGAGLMGHLRRLAAAGEEVGVPVSATIRVGTPPIDPTETMELAGFEQRCLIIEHPGSEELALPLFEGEYPKWRGILATHEPVATEAIALSPEIIGRLAKLGKLMPGALLWRFGGPVGAATLEIGSVSGAVMPMRWPGIDGPDEGKTTEGVSDLGAARARKKTTTEGEGTKP